MAEDEHEQHLPVDEDDGIDVDADVAGGPSPGDEDGAGTVAGATTIDSGGAGLRFFGATDTPR